MQKLHQKSPSAHNHTTLLVYVFATKACIDTTTTTTVLPLFVRDYPGEPVPEEALTHHHPDHHPVFISSFHLPRSIASCLLHMSSQYAELQPTTAEICWRVWGTPANFNGFRILPALLHGSLVVGVSQTLWH